jgi:hypothetical protein
MTAHPNSMVSAWILMSMMTTRTFIGHHRGHHQIVFITKTARRVCGTSLLTSDRREVVLLACRSTRACLRASPLKGMRRSSTGLVLRHPRCMILPSVRCLFLPSLLFFVTVSLWIMAKLFTSHFRVVGQRASGSGATDHDASTTHAATRPF